MRVACSTAAPRRWSARNTFILPQGRAAEAVLFELVRKILGQRHPGKVFTIPSNGHFDTTEGNIKQMGSIPRNLYNKELLWEVPEGGTYEKNPFKGNMDTEKLEELIVKLGPENVPLVYTTITNNTVCGQPVSLANLRESSRIAHKYGIPFMLDAARWAENAYFIKVNEEGCADKSIAEIAKEMFACCDGFTASLKKDGHANMGGILAFRDRGLFWKNFSDFNEDGTVKNDVGIQLKVKQISCYGNDSYGGMSGRDIMALAAGLYECQNFDYLDQRVKQCEYLAQGFYKAGVKGVVLPAGGHGVYINMDEFFDNKRAPESFAGQGLLHRAHPPLWHPHGRAGQLLHGVRPQNPGAEGGGLQRCALCRQPQPADAGAHGLCHRRREGAV